MYLVYRSIRGEGFDAADTAVIEADLLAKIQPFFAY